MRSAYLSLLISAICSATQEVTVTDHVYMKIKLGDNDLGRIVMGLFGDVVPKTAANLKGLCTTGDPQGRTYKGAEFHRVIKNFVAQGGDMVVGDGTGLTSIYDGNAFPDENFIIKHTSVGLLSMANYGPDTNGCQFSITLRLTPHLDGKHVVFGKVVEGFDSVVKRIEATDTDENDRPLKPVVITECGVLPLESGPYKLNF